MPNPLWQPSQDQIQNSQLTRFTREIEEDLGETFKNYEALHRWSCENLDAFWATFWDFAKIQCSARPKRVLANENQMPGAKWFQGARLNFAENLLRFRDDQTAIIFKGETQPLRKMTYRELYQEVARLAEALQAHGIQPGDRVVGFLPNMPEAIVAMLAATSLGATWSSCSPDFGVKGVLDRFGQIQPRVLFTANGYSFKGKDFSSIEKLSAILEELPSIEKVVVIPYTDSRADISSLRSAVHYNDFVGPKKNREVNFVQLPFDHPLYIMYSSGTTGLPKCMVQSAGGILLHQLKEQLLHVDLRREDHTFYFTTCGWMMWNWLVSSLGVGATVVLYDGNPFHPGPESLWTLADDTDMTVFGTSAGYIGALQASGYEPQKHHQLKNLRAILSTGSPLSVEGFRFIYDSVKKDVQLASISGGTDLNGCFALGNPNLPVYEGELQCRALAMNVHAFNQDGKPVINEQGELVCTSPFPSMPISFWKDTDGSKYKKAYFSHYPNVWRHGDFITVNERGGVTIFGRSDATLNPGGVRIGTAEIYRQVDSMDEIEDSIVVGQDWKNDVRVVLFVKPQAGTDLDDALIEKIKKNIRENTTPRHVPAKVLQVNDVPYTLNMKKVELAVKNVIEGKEVLNKDALKNPESLDQFKNLKQLQSD